MTKNASIHLLNCAFLMSVAVLFTRPGTVLSQDTDIGVLETAVVKSNTPKPKPKPPRPAPIAPRPVVAETVNIATRSEKKISDITPAVGVITEQDIARISPLSIDDLLRMEPNVEALGGPRYLGEQLIVRGEGGNAVTVRIDDARQNFVSGHAGQRFFVETDFLKEVEILRGAGSFLYGSGSAGVVNLSTLDPQDILNDSGALGLRLRNTYHSNTEEWAHSVLGAVSDGNFDIMAGTSLRDGNDITLGDGFVLPNSAVERESDIAKIVWRPNSENRFEFGYNNYESLDQGGANPQINGSTTDNPFVGRMVHFEQFNLNWQYKPIANDLVDTNLSIYYNETSQLRSYLADTGSNVGRTNRHALDVFGIDFSNRSEVTIGNREHEIVFGMDYFTENQDGEETRATFFTPGAPGNPGNRPDAEGDHFAVYLTDEVDVTDTLTLFTGLRYDTFTTSRLTGATIGQSGSEVLPHIGFDLDIGENLSLVGRYSKGFTQPTLNDLYQDGSHFGVVPDTDRGFPQTIREPQGGFFLPPPFGAGVPDPGLLRFNYFEEVFVPNPDLIPESSDNFELAVHYENDDVGGGRLSSRLTGFFKKGENTFDSEIVGGRSISNFNGFANPGPIIVPPATGGPLFPGGPSPTFFTGLEIDGQLNQAFRQTVNRAETNIYGMEFTLDYDADIWFASLNAAALRGEDTTTGNKLNNITGDQLSMTLGARPFEFLEIGTYGIWNDGREDRVNDPFSQTQAYDIYGVFATFQASEKWAIRVGVDNLFDQSYERSNVLQQEPGRNVFVSSTIYW